MEIKDSVEIVDAAASVHAKVDLKDQQVPDASTFVIQFASKLNELKTIIDQLDDNTLSGGQLKMRSWAEGVKNFYVKLEESVGSLSFDGAELESLLDVLVVMHEQSHNFDLLLYPKLRDFTNIPEVQDSIKNYISAHQPVSKYLSPIGEAESRQLRKLIVAYELLDPNLPESKIFRNQELEIGEESIQVAALELVQGISQGELSGAKVHKLALIDESLKGSVWEASFNIQNAASENSSIKLVFTTTPFALTPLNVIGWKFDLAGNLRTNTTRHQISLASISLINELGQARKMSSEEIANLYQQEKITSSSPPGGDGMLLLAMVDRE